MSAATARMLEAAAWMRDDPEPIYPVLSVWLLRVAKDAVRREGNQAPDVHAQFLTSGERADATRAAETYLTAFLQGATP